MVPERIRCFGQFYTGGKKLVFIFCRILRKEKYFFLKSGFIVVIAIFAV